MKKLVVTFISIFILFISFITFIQKINVDNNTYMINLAGMNINTIKDYALVNNLDLTVTEEYSDNILKDSVISQSIKPGTIINKNDALEVFISSGLDYNKYKVNELGNIPVMMYHQIIDKENANNLYPNGNVDQEGYSRTKEAFRNDLEFYYKNNYRMIRLTDYVDGIIDVELGYSPIVITFDDGINNVKVLGKDEFGNLIIDPNCALGILEEYKNKYPDFNVTATFFLNTELFRCGEYDNEVLNYVINHGYDIGNHTVNHPNINNISALETEKEVGKMYEKLENIINDKYVNIVALPYGNPSQNNSNFSHVLTSKYNGKTYETKSTLRVSWEANYSCFNKSFDKTYIKRIRAYTGPSGIEDNFKKLENNRYISDGNKDVVTVKYKDKDFVNTNLKLVTY